MAHSSDKPAPDAHEYHLSATPFWRIVSVLPLFASCLVLLRLYQGEDIMGTFDWVLIYAAPLYAVFGLFFVQTLVVKISSEGVSSSWYIGVLRFKIIEFNRSVMFWRDVRRVSEVSGFFAPEKNSLYVNIIGCNIDGKACHVSLGKVFGNHSVAIRYSLGKIPRHLIDQEVLDKVELLE